MSRILILGATGSLGRHVLHQALAAGHEVTVFVRNFSSLNAIDGLSASPPAWPPAAEA